MIRKLTEVKGTDDESKVRKQLDSLIVEANEITASAYSNPALYSDLRGEIPSGKTLEMLQNFIRTVKDAKLTSIKNKAKVLDIGTSFRDFNWLSKQSDITVTGIDLSENVLKAIAEQSISAAVYVMDMQNLEFPDETFAGIRCNAALHHLPLIDSRQGAAAAVREAYRVLAEGGIYYIAVKAGEGFVLVEDELGRRFFQLYSKKTLRDLLESQGFILLGDIEEWIDEERDEKILIVFAKKITKIQKKIPDIFARANGETINLSEVIQVFRGLGINIGKESGGWRVKSYDINKLEEAAKENHLMLRPRPKAGTEGRSYEGEIIYIDNKEDLGKLPEAEWIDINPPIVLSGKTIHSQNEVRFVLAKIKNKEGSIELKPAACKIFNEAQDFYLLREELICVQIADKIGRSPHFYGVIRNENNNITGYVTEYVPGKAEDYFYESVGENPLFKAFWDVGVLPPKEVIETPVGAILAIDVGPEGYQSAFVEESDVKNFIDKYNEGTAGDKLRRLKAEQRTALVIDADLARRTKIVKILVNIGFKRENIIELQLAQSGISADLIIDNSGNSIDSITKILNIDIDRIANIMQNLSEDNARNKIDAWLDTQL